MDGCPENEETDIRISDARVAECARRSPRAEGHLRSIRQMVVDHRCAEEILIQIAAVKGALNQTAAALIDSEMRSCVETCMSGSTEERLERVAKALSAVLKSS